MSRSQSPNRLGGFRPLTANESGILAPLLKAEFPGQVQLAQQAARISARPLDADGSLEFAQSDGPLAPVVRRIPVEAEAEDQDGVMIHVLLHVVDGQLKELEVYREDSAPVMKLDPGRLRVLVL